jgi:hypothetical protein
MRSKARIVVTPFVLVLIILLAVSLGGLGYFYYQASSLQNLTNAGASIKIVHWEASYNSATLQALYEVKVTNGNSFDVTLSQLTISVVDNTGTQVAGNTLAPQAVITAGNSVTTEISVNFPANGAGHSVQAIITTPYGQVIIGSV